MYTRNWLAINLVPAAFRFADKFTNKISPESTTTSTRTSMGVPIKKTKFHKFEKHNLRYKYININICTHSSKLVL